MLNRSRPKGRAGSIPAPSVTIDTTMQKIYMLMIFAGGMALVITVLGLLFDWALSDPRNDEDIIQDMTREEKRDVFVEPILPPSDK